MKYYLRAIVKCSPVFQRERVFGGDSHGEFTRWSVVPEEHMSDGTAVCVGMACLGKCSILWTAGNTRSEGEEHEQKLEEGKAIVLETFGVSILKVLNRRKAVQGILFKFLFISATEATQLISLVKNHVQQWQLFIAQLCMDMCAFTIAVICLPRKYGDQYNPMLFFSVQLNPLNVHVLFDRYIFNL